MSCMLNVVLSAGIASTLGAGALFVLFIIFFAKLINVMKTGELYDIILMIVGLIAAVFCHIFVMLGVMIDQTLIMAALTKISWFLIALIVILFFLELFVTFANITFRNRYLPENKKR